MNTAESNSSVRASQAIDEAGLEGPFGRLGEQVVVRSGLIGESLAVSTLLHRVRRLAPSDIPILIVGESGAGKENVARALHLNSSRSAHPFASEACAVLREPFFLRQMFGHVRGAFTGATAAVPGILDAVDGGTLYLDEIAELSPLAQAALSRCLETGEYRPLGSASARRAEFRLVASTAADLDALSVSGLFRRDLYHRLRGAVIDVPPLRARRADILPLASRCIGEESRRLGRAPPSLTAEAQTALLSYSWPGNVRELFHEIRQAIAMTDSNDLTPSLFQFVRDPVKPRDPNEPRTTPWLRDRLGSVESEAIRDAMRLAGGNKADAARRLGLTRRTLYRRLHALGYFDRRAASGSGHDRIANSDAN